MANLSYLVIEELRYCDGNTFSNIVHQPSTAAFHHVVSKHFIARVGSLADTTPFGRKYSVQRHVLDAYLKWEAYQGPMIRTVLQETVMADEETRKRKVRKDAKDAKEAKKAKTASSNGNPAVLQESTSVNQIRRTVARTTAPRKQQPTAIPQAAQYGQAGPGASAQRHQGPKGGLKPMR